MTERQKAMSIRLPEPLAEDLEEVARVDGEPVAFALRVAVAQYVAARHADPVWQARLVASAEKAAASVRRVLGDGSGVAS
jgi:predicted transcriptional regulator